MLIVWVYLQFFSAYVNLLQSPNYVTRRQSLKVCAIFSAVKSLWLHFCFIYVLLDLLLMVCFLKWLVR
jgi:hypothetical protein